MPMIDGKLVMTHTRAALPDARAASEAFRRGLDAVETNDELSALVADWESTADRVIEAIWRDTSHVNRLETIRQVYKSSKTYSPSFGASLFVIVRLVLLLETGWHWSGDHQADMAHVRAAFPDLFPPEPEPAT